LTVLAEADGCLARIVELRYFVGCGIQETARLLQVSQAAVKRDWTYVRAWIFEYMSR
jgi:DNA-directed RNA polymerase specialized sigma24 family protein